MPVDRNVIPDVNQDSSVQVSTGPAGPDGTPMDMTQTVQSDGNTVVKRERVDLGFTAADDNPMGPLVASYQPLPTADEQVIGLLTDLNKKLDKVIELLQYAMMD